jgi:hypothetical protein
VLTESSDGRPMILLHPGRTNAGPSTWLGAKNAPTFAQDDGFYFLALRRCWRAGRYGFEADLNGA